MKNNCKWVLIAVCLLFWAVWPAAGFQSQDARGAIVGRVTDASSAVMPGVDVRATNAATGVVASAKTNESGNFLIPYLLPGTYTLQAEIPGFKRFVREGIEVRVSDRVEVNITMTVGVVTETVEVTAETPVLETATTSLGQVVDERRITELPLFAGNAMDLVHLAPGTINGTDMRLRKAPFNNAPSQFSTDGSGNYGNAFTIDGVSNLYSDGTSPRVAFSPPTAALAEFKVETSAFDASAGRTLGSVVNVSTKGGTNTLHGQVWEWLRHSALDSATIFQNRATIAPGARRIPVYQDNRYGAAGGGPVYIPGVYNGKNKTFWHFTFEKNVFGDPNVGGSMTSTVPRDQWKNGDLSDLLALGANYQVYDPATIKAEPNGTFSRQPFPGNIIPPDRIHPVAKKILALWPSPNQPGTANGAQNFFMSKPAKEYYWTSIGRIDHAFSEQNRMFIRFHRDFWEEDKNRNFGDDVNGIILNRINRGLAVDDVHVFTPTFLLNVRWGVSAQEFPERRVSKGFDLASLGFSQTLVNLVDKSVAVIPRIQVSPFTTISSWESGDGVTSSVSHNAVANFTWIKGDHNIRFGPEYQVFREFRNRYPTGAAPDFNFDSLWGRGPLNTSAAPPVGAQLVSLLLGIPGGSMSINGSYAEQDTYLGLYIQDDWKVTRKLTLNLGFRVEHESPITERFNRAATQWDAVTPNPIAEAAIANYAAQRQMPELPLSDFKVLGGITFAGVGGNPREYWNGPGINLLPRVGFAYQATPKTVVRAAYGIFYSSIGVLYTNTQQPGFTRSTPISPSSDNGLTFTALLDNPLPNGLLPVIGAAEGLTTTLNQGVTFFAKDRKRPYAQRWSFGIQRELPGGHVVEVAYVGNRGTRLGVTRNINVTPGKYFSTHPVRWEDDVRYLAETFPNPFFGLNPQFTSSTISRQNLLKPYPHFGDLNFSDPVGYSWYHSMQSRLEKRFSRGYTLQMAYTWSKTMQATQFLNAFDPMPYEELSDLDRPHRLTGSGIWELPFGRGRAIGSNWHPVLNFIGGGWQLGGVYQFQSGNPLGWGNISFFGNPDDVKLPRSERSVDRWFNPEPFNRVSNLQPASNVRTMPFRFSDLRADTQRRWDFSLSKSFTIREGVTMRFRADTFNAFNQVVLKDPDRTPTSGSFGRITGQEPPRSWQLGLRLVF
ncbi:MAG: TonB-dependent receptor domain-containing protein [Rhodospirillales bacterium]